MSEPEKSSNYIVAEAQLLAERARRDKAAVLKDIGEPIELPGKALAIEVQGNSAWIAENTTVVKKLDLESGKVLQIYKGHTAPVTCIAFYNPDRKLLISGSWDKTIRVWDTKTKVLLSTTPDAHSDFVKTVVVLPSLNLLLSGGSDKIVRFWDLTDVTKPLQNAGSISSHTRPVECIAGYAISDTSAVIYTADTMGVIRVWNLQKEPETTPPLWRATARGELNHHRTRINELLVGKDLVWTASADETVQIHPAIEVENLSEDAAALKGPKAITHPVAARALLPLTLTELGEPYLLTVAGDVLRVYDISSLSDPELLSSTDIHWHDVTAIRLWYRTTVKEDVKHTEPWIVTTSLDQTIRKWRLTELLNPTPPPAPEEKKKTELEPIRESDLTEEEERELAELLDED
ncbi:WD40 repeat-like protein [Coprinopsis marcescibilis]|uniref:WD40 repeat-like protein n=1 Tax=Coprinopsis marcescibilis TaxID=230819 RepID=A0A5C3KX20_COPMA|nr:WD40 repeat-like protein [Coprinopsis marcescibilis]